MTVTDDTSLVTRSRDGDTAAYAELYARHVGVALGVARQVADRDAEDVVSEAFARTFTALRDGGGPREAFRPYLLRAVRNAAVDRHRRERRTSPVGDLDEAQAPLHQEREAGDPVVARLEQELAVRAFATLPPRWQTVLWHMEIQGERPAQVAPLLGISPRAVSQLAVRAREGLRTAWLGEHAAHVPPGHEEVAGLLAPSVRSSLSRRDRRVLEDHLTTCPRCRGVREELVEVNATMSADLLLPVLGLVAAGAGFHLPGGAVLDAAGAATGAAAPPSAATPSGATGAGAAPGGHGVLAGVSGVASHPVAAGVVALVVAASGAGAYLAWRSQQEPSGGSTPSVSSTLTPDDGQDLGETTTPSTPPSPSPTSTAVPTSSAPPTPSTTSPTSAPAPPPPPSPSSTSPTTTSPPGSASSTSSSASPSSTPSASSTSSSSSSAPSSRSSPPKTLQG